LKRSTERILTTHTGSLPRPPDLLGMLEALGRSNLVEPDIAWAKLKSMAEGARLSSEQLWR